MEFVIEILKTVVLGIIQGITEWLPISSTGHMILADAFLNLNQPKEFMDMFYVVIQLGSILAVVVLYFQKLNPFSPSKSRAERLSTFQLWFKVLVAVLPIGVIGLLVDDWVTEHFYTPTVVAAALIIYGVLFILLEKRNKQVKPRIRSFEQLSYRTAACIGFLQLLAIIPGTSRSGSTILGAMLLSCSRFVATEFSFFMAIPVMFGASAYKIAVCHQVPDELHPQARLHRLRLVPHRAGHRGHPLLWRAGSDGLTVFLHTKKETSFEDVSFFHHLFSCGPLCRFLRATRDIHRRCSGGRRCRPG